MKVYPSRDIRLFVMYGVNGKPRSSLLIESTDSMINFPYSTCIKSFFGSSILTSLFVFKCFFGLVSVIFLLYIANVTHRTFEIVQKNRDPANIKIISLYPYTNTIYGK